MKKLLLITALLVPTSVSAATEYDDPKFQNSSDCRYYLQFDPEITQCINHVETKKCNTLRPHYCCGSSSTAINVADLPPAEKGR